MFMGVPLLCRTGLETGELALTTVTAAQAFLSPPLGGRISVEGADVDKEDVAAALRGFEGVGVEVVQGEEGEDRVIGSVSYVAEIRPNYPTECAAMKAMAVKLLGRPGLSRTGRPAHDCRTAVRG